ncbi:MAG: hypothetical protein DRR16_29170 [Candidatus Parabeggiatoa sp. nov. 3]|nr:MAG: hypothetical protein DRR00_30775 [Gammaproteobacteria bacterium]RKZ52489.1 MAG: hypothetical protein DRQ99_32430 [Gammaproteobacteria bacterium]RKZ77691.1 MAG: hypothetical protein DRR16_29170 [Gammaproteobacteria bacterium]HEW97234.1 hypothetical protein [Beggiatoa sp.]
MSYAQLKTYEPTRVPIPRFKTGVIRKLKPDRPAWIPAHITENWDTDPFAYQTEEELMRGGGLYGQFLMDVAISLRYYLEKQGLMLLLDTFLIYRNSKQVKHRIGPDLLLMEDCFQAPSSYDLDTRPPPRCLIEITSPKSHLKDLQNNVALYFGLGAETYFVIDGVTPQNKWRVPIELHLWRKTKGQAYQKMGPDNAGYFLLPEMNIKIAVQEQRFIFVNAVTGEVLRDNGQLSEALAQSEERANAEAQRAEIAFEDGEQNKALETARKMLADGFSPAIIMKYTGLSEKDM